MPRVSFDEYSIYYETTGSGPPLVSIAGWTASGLIFRPLFSHLSGDFTCISFDIPGFGRSYGPKTMDYSPQNVADVAKSFIDSIEIERFTLMGTSIGGMYALKMALSCPESVETLVLLNSVLHRSGMTLPVRLPNLPIWREYAYLVLRIYTPTFFLAAISAWAFLHPLKTMREIGLGAILDTIRDMRRSYKNWTAYRSAKATVRADLRSEARDIQMDTLIIGADKDRFVQPRHYALMNELIPGSKLVIFEDCGHAGLLEFPEMYASAIREFFAD